MDKYLSVITNFGCHYECPYCVSKENHLQYPKTTIEGLNNLEKYYKKYKCNWISISGGGDPLYGYYLHNKWWYRLFEITKFNNNFKLELHTSETHPDIFRLYCLKHPDKPTTNTSIFKFFDRVVYHCLYVSEIKNIRRYERDYPEEAQKVRVVFVVTKKFTPKLINKIVQEVKKNPNIDELSFRQMIDSDYKTTNYCYDYLKKGHGKDWYYIEQGDYNLYYCENKVYNRFEEFKELGKGNN